jgi:hypothetical protein
MVNQMIVNGWEFYILNPFDENIEQKSQSEYDKKYESSYKKFIEELCIEEPQELFENDDLFTFYISCDEKSDKIELEENFSVIFKKSIFLKIKYKKIKSELELYYDSFGIGVRNLYKSGDYIFLILEKSNK